MSIDKISKIRKDKKGIIGIFISVFFGILGLITFYVSYVKVDNPNIGITIENQTEIIDVKKPLTDLVVYYKNNDIVKGNLHLQFVKIKFKNIGDINITNEMYEKNDIWGLQIDGADILETRLSEASSSYLKINQKPKITLRNIVALKKLIFDKDESYTIELLILYKNNTKYQIYSIGKISGIKNKLKIEPYIAESENHNIFYNAFSGNIKIQLLRFGTYFIGISILSIILVFVAALVEDKKEKLLHKKRKSLLDISIPSWSKSEKKYQWIYNYYIHTGNSGIFKISKLLKDTVKIKSIYDKYRHKHGISTINIDFDILENYTATNFIAKSIQEKLIQYSRAIIIDKKLIEIVNGIVLVAK